MCSCQGVSQRRESAMIIKEKEEVFTVGEDVKKESMEFGGVILV